MGTWPSLFCCSYWHLVPGVKPQSLKLSISEQVGLVMPDCKAWSTTTRWQNVCQHPLKQVNTSEPSHWITKHISLEMSNLKKKKNSEPKPQAWQDSTAVSISLLPSTASLTLMSCLTKKPSSALRRLGCRRSQPFCSYYLFPYKLRTQDKQRVKEECFHLGQNV